MFDAEPQSAASINGGAPGHESLATVSDYETGLEAVIAIHSTARGPAFGGCRYWPYADREAAIRDAQRLAEGMSLKNALAGLPFGGGKSVILRTGRQPRREELFEAFGRFVASQDGRYITAEDVGTTVADMQAVASQTRYVSGLVGEGAHGGNPSPKTALGVFVSIRRAAALVLGRSDLEGVTVAVQGLGTVGWELCRLLAGDGCKLIVADIDDTRTARAVESFGASACPVDRILSADAQILTPCALGAVLNPQSIPGIRASIVAGAANNQLLSLADGDALHRKGIYYLPDYLVNAGGIIAVVREYQRSAGDEAIDAEVRKIADRVEELVERVRQQDLPPATVAEAWARSLLVRRERSEAP